MTKILELQLEHSGLASLKIDWFDLLAIQGTLGSLLHHHSFKGINSLAPCLLHGPALTTVCDHWEDRGLTIWTFVIRVISLLFSTLSRCHSFPAKKQLSSDFMTAGTILSDFRTQEEEICPYLHLFPSICHEVMGPDAILVFLMFSFKPFTLLLHPHQETVQFLFTFYHYSGIIQMGNLPIEYLNYHLIIIFSYQLQLPCYGK